jgi:hypothetical protein
LLCTAPRARYAIVLVLVVFLAYINLIFGVKFTEAQSSAWMLSMGIGYVSSRFMLGGECL